MKDTASKLLQTKGVTIGESTDMHTMELVFKQKVKISGVVEVIESKMAKYGFKLFTIDEYYEGNNQVRVTLRVK